MKRYLMWLCLFFVSGIVCFCNLTVPIIKYSMFIFCGAVLACCLVRKKPMLIFSLLLLAAFFCGRAIIIRDSVDNGRFEPYGNEKRVILGVVTDSYLTEEYCVCNVRCSSVDYTPVSGNIKLYVKGSGLYRYGDRLHIAARLLPCSQPKKKDEPDYRAYNFSRHIYASCFADSWAVKVKGHSEKTLDPSRLGWAARVRIKEIISSVLPSEESGILTALMLGDKSGVSDEFKEIGSSVGIYHTMATSGLHVSIILSFFAVMLSEIPHRRRLTATLSIVLLCGMYMVIGYSPSISRAVIMAMLSALACITLSKSDSYTALALSAALIALFRPYALFDTGFLLSFSSTLGLVVIFSRLKALVKLRWLYSLLTAVSALLGTAAITACYFGRITLLGTLSNLLIVPLAGLILPVGVIMVLSGTVWLVAADFLSYSLYAMLRLYVKIAELFSRLPFSSAEVEKPPAYTTFFVTILIFAVFMLIPSGGERYEGGTTEKRFTERSN